MTFPLQMLAPAIGAGRNLGQAGHVPASVPDPAEPRKPVVQVELESAAWLVQIMIWYSGEAELETIRLSDDRIVNKHYDLTSRGDLNALLDELAQFLVQDHVPDAAVVFHAPGPSARHADTAPRGVIRRRRIDRHAHPEGHRPHVAASAADPPRMSRASANGDEPTSHQRT